MTNRGNEPAYPVPAYLDKADETGTKLIVMASDGMTIRQKTASDQMAGLNANPAYNDESCDEMAKIACESADDLLAELDKEGG